MEIAYAQLKRLLFILTINVLCTVVLDAFKTLVLQLRIKPDAPIARKIVTMVSDKPRLNAVFLAPIK